MGVYAKIVADSVAPDGTRITTWEKRHHRWVLAEMNTHAAAAKNSASSRARPILKVIDDIRDDPARPLVWASEQRGMQGGDPVGVEPATLARVAWDRHREDALRLARELRDLGIHKSVTNRILEPHMMHTSVWTVTAIENFFDQRCHPDAQPEIRAVAEAMREAYEASTPTPVGVGEWHLPYIHHVDRELAVGHADRLELGVETVLARVSAARVARTSYVTQNGVRDLSADLALYGRLASDRIEADEPPHWSPLEQVATPCPENRQRGPLTVPGGATYPVDHLPKVGKFAGWLSMRHIVEAETGIVTFR